MLGVTVTVTLPEPDSRSGVRSGPVRNPALAAVGASIRAAQSASLSFGSSVKVSVVPRGALRVPSRPTPGAVPPRGRSVVGAVPGAGHRGSVDQVPGERSISAIGVRSMPLS